mgnify:CR=1 FL=1
MEKLYSKRSLIIRIVISILIVCMGVLSFVFQGAIENSMAGGEIYALEDSSFRLFIVDVGQGDAIYMEFPDGKNMLVDCGSEDESPNLISFLNSRKVKKIDYVIYTHADEDHIGGGEKIFSTYEIQSLYRPKILCLTESRTGNPAGYNVKDTEIYDRAIMAAYDEECEIKYSFEGEEITGEGYIAKFLNPNKDNYSNSNDYSAVIMIECNGKKVLLQGDAEKDVEERLLLDYGSYLDADILKIAHHGSKTGTSQTFLNTVSPEYAIISSGSNAWGLPDVEIIERLEAEDFTTYQTQDIGTICFGITPNGEVTSYGLLTLKKFDIPLVVSLVILAALLTWGIHFPTKKEKLEKAA